MMEPEVQQDTKDVTVQISTDASGGLTTVSTDPSSDQWQEIGAKVSEFLSDLPGYLSTFFGEYRRPIINISLFIAALVAIKLLLAVLGAINDLPLFSSLFELIGMGYSAWFVWRYLLKASTREQLLGELGSFKEQIMGK
jgi:hypothetical protein